MTVGGYHPNYPNLPKAILLNHLNKNLATLIEPEPHVNFSFVKASREMSVKKKRIFIGHECNVTVPLLRAVSMITMSETCYPMAPNDRTDIFFC